MISNVFSEWMFFKFVFVFYLFFTQQLVVSIEVPKNGSEEDIINFLETNKWVKSYSDLYYIVGKFWEPSKEEINSHHNYSRLTEYLTKLASKYPQLCDLNSIGRSVEGRNLWVITIGKEPRTHIPGRPEFKYVANMHGNEVMGREALLHLAAVLVHNYDRNLYIQQLLDTTRIHLMPSMNPDGYEKSQEGDESGVRGRSNANGVDLNRNFPHQDSYRAYYQPNSSPVQKETHLIMQWTKSIPFVLSANLHSGTTLVNYPFDDGHGNRARTGDNELFISLAYSYARGHKRMFKKGFRCIDSKLNDPLDPVLGIVNGASWYEVSGGMQDWNYIFADCFELTVEMNCVKFPKANQLYDLWNEHKLALLHFINQAHHTINGFIFNEQSGVGILNASISIGSKEKVVYSFRAGDYYRPILPGTYEVQFQHPHYYPKFFVLKVSEYKRSLNFNVTLRPHSYLTTGELRQLNGVTSSIQRHQLSHNLFAFSFILILLHKLRFF